MLTNLSPVHLVITILILAVLVAAIIWFVRSVQKNHRDRELRKNGREGTSGPGA